MEQRGEAALVGVGERVGPFGQREGVLDHQGVDVAQAALQDVQAQHREFLFFAPGGGGGRSDLERNPAVGLRSVLIQGLCSQAAAMSVNELFGGSGGEAAMCVLRCAGAG